MTIERGNEIDEFVVDALRNSLLGLPLDLPAINIARGRDTGMPTLNQAREQLYAASGSSFLTPYASWTEFAANLKNPLSVVNFIAAYGTHAVDHADGTLEREARRGCWRRWCSAMTRRDGVIRYRACRPATSSTAPAPERREQRPQQHRSLDRRPGREEDAVRRHARLDLQRGVRAADGEPAGRRPILLPDPHPGPELPE